MEATTNENIHRLHLRGEHLKSLGKNNKTIHQISLDASISAPTGYRMLTEKAKKIKQLDLNNLAAVMIKGIGLTPEEFMALKLSDLFEIVDQLVPEPSGK